MEVRAEAMQDMVDYIEETQPTIKKLAETEDAVRSMAPRVVDTLIEKGALDASQRDRAIVSIQDPVRALESLEKLANAFGARKAVETAPPSLGTPEHTTEKAAGEYTSDADDAFLRKIGLK